MRVDSSPQMLQKNGIGYFFLAPAAVRRGGAAQGCVTRARQRCASLSIT
jgi:hypothetical protein